MLTPLTQASLLLLSLLLPLLGALYFAAAPRRNEDEGGPSGLILFSWIYAAVAALTAILALRTGGGITLAAPVLGLGASGFELEPRLFLDGRSAPFLLLLGLCPPVVFGILRRQVADRAQAALAWLLVFCLAGVFLADSLLLFYLFWEGALVAVYFWIGLRGGRKGTGEGAYPALLRFVLFTLAGSLPMLAAIAASCAANFRDPGLRGLAAAIASMPDSVRVWVFLGFLLGFAVKLPLLGFHGWLRETYEAAPPACRALLSAAMSKMGAYGLLLVLAPAFPVEMTRFALPLQILAAAGALYGGLLMLAQDRLTDLLAYSSLSHLSLLALAVFASASGASTSGFPAAGVLALSHALIMAALFALDARALKNGESADRLRVAGLRARQPRLFAFLLLAAFASASLPGLSNFPGELLAMYAAYKTSPWLAFVAGLGALIGAAALVRFLHAAWLGRDEEGSTKETASEDLNGSETAVLIALGALWFVLGLWPMLVLGPVGRAFDFVATLGWMP
jgi:NADH-quinone oxidoreductase subunit M